MATSPVQQRAASPVFSTLSMKTDQSIPEPINFSDLKPSPVQQRAASPVFSTLSMKTDQSIPEPINFSDLKPSPVQQRAASPVFSTLSMKTDQSIPEPINFSDLKTSNKQNEEKQTIEDGSSNRIYTSHLKKKILAQYGTEMDRKHMDSELYIIEGTDSKETATKTKYQKLFTSGFLNKAPKHVLTRGVDGIGKTFQAQMFMVDWAKGKCETSLIFPIDLGKLYCKESEVQSLQELLDNFFKGMPKAPDYDKFEVTIVLDGLNELQLPLDFGSENDLTDVKATASVDRLLTSLIKGKLMPSAHLWIIARPSTAAKIPLEYINRVTECRESFNRQEKLSLSLKRRLIEELPQNEVANHPNRTNTEHILKESGNEKGKSKPAISLCEIFKPKGDQTVRIVLTIGEAGIGKTFHAQKLMRDWARQEAQTSASPLKWIKGFLDKVRENDKTAEVIFPLSFPQLNCIQEKLSFQELLNNTFKETKDFVISNYVKLKVVIVLDGLNKCTLPLNFDRNDTLTNVREKASVDTLLTNLINGNLLPSACLWITSLPSAVQQIPSKFLDRVTEIRERPEVVSKRKLKARLTERFHRVSEGITKQANSALLHEIYTELYIVEGEPGEVNSQSECRQVQAASFKTAREEKPIKHCDIFKPVCGRNNNIRTVLTNGIAGIGKTIALQKYMLDWAEDKANQDIDFIFTLPFRELNLRKEEEYSLETLLHQFFPEMRDSEITNYDRYRILIVLDGLDECRLDLNFTESTSPIFCTDLTTVNALLTNLIQGNLLSEACLWITSRPAASRGIPPEHVDLVTEVRGFNGPQKEQYFKKRFSEKGMADRIISYVQKSRSLYIMCHIPVFCWITSTVVKEILSTVQKTDMPKTLTDMYLRFLILQCKQSIKKFQNGETNDGAAQDSCWNEKNKDIVLSLGKLAFEELEKGNLVFMEEDLDHRGVSITECAVYSGLFTQISRDNCELFNQKLFCFVHLSIQEFLAALYVFLTFINKGQNLLTTVASTLSEKPTSNFYKSAVDKALENENGDWDMFLRFLVGLSLETNQKPLQDLLVTSAESPSQTNQDTIKYIKDRIQEDINVDKSINLFHCLNELNDHSLVEEIKKSLAYEAYSPSQWMALTFVLLTSDVNLDVFDLKKYLKSEKVLLGMLPVVEIAKTALLSWCDLTYQSCKGLTSLVLRSSSSNLTELDLSNNDIMDSGVEMLSEGLKNINCRVKIIRLSGCQVTEIGCQSLVAALKSSSSPVKELDLRYNHPGESGKQQLSAIADDPQSSLITVRLEYCGEHRLKPGMKKYGVPLTLDKNTAGRKVVLLNHRKARRRGKNEDDVPYPDHPDRFKRSQVLCKEGLSNLCYWEVEWKGNVGIAASYRGINRNQWDSSAGLGTNPISWNLNLSEKTPTKHSCKGWPANENKELVSEKLPNTFPKIGVLLDWEGGTLDYYSVSSAKPILIHHFQAQFTEPVYPGFWFKRGCVSLCD